MSDTLELPHDPYKYSWALARLAVQEAIRWEKIRLLEQASVLARTK